MIWCTFFRIMILITRQGRPIVGGGGWRGILGALDPQNKSYYF